MKKILLIIILLFAYSNAHAGCDEARALEKENKLQELLK